MLARQGIQALFYDDETPQEIRRPQRRALISGSCVEVKWMRSLDGLLFGKGMVGNGMGNPEDWVFIPSRVEDRDNPQDTGVDDCLRVPGS